jgi:heptosyltransferase-3
MDTGPLPRRLRIDPVRRIIVICTRLIGDVLLTTPLIAAAHRRWPDARIDVLGFEGTLGMLEGNPMIDRLIAVPAGSGWLQSLPLIVQLWRRYDLALIAQYSDRAHLYGLIAGRVRSGLVSPDKVYSWWKRLLLQHRVVFEAGHSHAALEKFGLLAPWARPPERVEVIAPPPAPLPEDVGTQLRERYVVLHVPSRVAYKRWPLRHQRTLVQGLIDDGWQVVLTGGPSAEDREQTGELARSVASPQVLDVSGRLDFNQLVQLLQGAALYVGPDTSVTHLAAAADVPVIATYGPIDPRLWGPWPQGHPPTQPYRASGYVQRIGRNVLLQGDQPCVPCSLAGCERHEGSRSDCLETMSGERVLTEARLVLAGGERAAPAMAMTRTIPIVAASRRENASGDGT